MDGSFPPLWNLTPWNALSPLKHTLFLDSGTFPGFAPVPLAGLPPSPFVAPWFWDTTKLPHPQLWAYLSNRLKHPTASWITQLGYLTVLLSLTKVENGSLGSSLISPQPPPALDCFFLNLLHLSKLLSYHPVPQSKNVGFILNSSPPPHCPIWSICKSRGFFLQRDVPIYLSPGLLSFLCLEMVTFLWVSCLFFALLKFTF